MYSDKSDWVEGITFQTHFMPYRKKNPKNTWYFNLKVAFFTGWYFQYHFILINMNEFTSYKKLLKK